MRTLFVTRTDVWNVWVRRRPHTMPRVLCYKGWSAMTGIKINVNETVRVTIAAERKGQSR